MNKIIFFLILFFIINSSWAIEVTVIELHNKSIDQLLNEEKKNIEINLYEDSLTNKNKKSSENLLEEDILGNNNITSNNVEEMPDIWKQTEKENLIFLLENITLINSITLKNEMLEVLYRANTLPQDFSNQDFYKLIIDTLLKLGRREKSFEIINSMEIAKDNVYHNFYIKFILNHYLSTYNLSEACNLRKETKKFNLINVSNFYLKIDIFCLALEEKYDEANLLNSLLTESKEKDKYFQELFSKLKNPDFEIDLIKNNIIEENIFLYSAMHRIANLALSEKFLEIDPINLSLPIILSSSTNIELRLKAANFAFFNQLINNDSLAALYQSVDFTYDELNNSSNYITSINNDAELGMAYFYQLINIQLLPITRLEAIMQFWDFAQKNNLENIAYTLSLKILDTFEPSNELAEFGPAISKAYIVGKKYEEARKWLLFSEGYFVDNNNINKLNSSKLLLNLSTVTKDQNLSDVLFNSILNNNDIQYNEKNEEDIKQNEIMNLIFSILNPTKDNIFPVEKKILDNRLIPSLYILNMIRDSDKNDNQIQLLFSIIISINGKKWNDIHPEHLGLILNNIKKYKNGVIFNDVLLEILKDNKII